MGSNPSKNEVVNIRISSSKGRKETSDELFSPGANKTTNNREQVDRLSLELVKLKKELKTEKKRNIESEDLSFSLQNQVDEREREVLLLREEIDSLQCTAATSNDNEMKTSQNSENEEKCDRTIHAKDQYIQTLEKDLKMLKEHTDKQNERYQKKLRKIKSLSSRSRQDSSLKMFELKDENSKLVGENTKLQERLERTSIDSADFGRQGSATSKNSIQSHGNDVTVLDHHDDPRMKLILDLSEQVANLDSENLKLKQELRHCRKIAERVETVRVQAKKNASGRTDVMYVDSGHSSWKGLENGRACVEIGEKA